MAANLEIHEFHAKLRKIGWNISTEGIIECTQELGQQERTVENIAKWSLNCDLKEIGLKVLTDEVKRGQVKLVEGPLVLQIQKIRNVSAPKANEDSGAAPRLLKLQLTDGHTTCFALEHSLIQKLSLSTPPGTKIRIKGTVPLLCGFMLLEPRQVEVLGGKVEKLILKWETNKSVSQQRAKPGLPNDDGPPFFVAFDPKTSSGVKRTSALKPNHQNPKDPLSSQESSCNQKDENKKENAAFEHSRDQRILTAKHQSIPAKNTNKSNRVENQRRQPISSSDRDQKRVGEDQAAKPSGSKQQAFGPNKSNVRDAQFTDKDNGEKYVKKDNYIRRPASQKGGRHNDDISDEYSTSKPLEGTLWDFLETKLPSKGSKTEKVKPMHSTVDQIEKGDNQNTQQPSSDGQYRSQHEKGDFEKGGHQGIRDGHRGNRQHERAGQVRDRYVDQHKKTPERSSSQNSQKEQVPQKRDDKLNNRRNETRFYNKSQQPVSKNNNQSGKSGKDGDRQDNQTNGKVFPKYDQEADSGESKHKITRVEDRTSNYTSKSHKSEKEERVLMDQNNPKIKAEQSVHVNKKETGVDRKRPQQRGKHDEQHGVTRRDVQRYEEHAEISKKEQENASRRVNNHHRNQRERYEEHGRRNESRKQHWWKEGEDCMAFRSENRQHYPAKVMNVEARSRSCAVIFHDTGKQETINWSNLLPLNMQSNSDIAFQYQESLSHPSTAPQNWYMQQRPSFTAQFNQLRSSIPGHDAVRESEMRQRSRPTQAFYRPPRGTTE